MKFVKLRDQKWTKTRLKDKMNLIKIPWKITNKWRSSRLSQRLSQGHLAKEIKKVRGENFIPFPLAY